MYYLEIWKHQFPATCEDKRFLIVPLNIAGMGSITHNQIMAWGSIEQWKCFLYIVIDYSMACLYNYVITIHKWLLCC